MSDTPLLDIDQDEFIELAGDPTDRRVVVRTVASLSVDTTPLEAYAALTGRSGDNAFSPYSFLLESAQKTASSDPDGAFQPSGARPDRHARFSFVGFDPEAVITIDEDGPQVRALASDTAAELFEPTTDGDTLDSLRSVLPDVRLANFTSLNRQHLDGGLVGFIAYDAVYDLWLEEVGIERPPSRFPDAEFVLTTKTLVFDDVEETISLVLTPILTAEDDPATVYSELESVAETVESTIESADPLTVGGFEPESEFAESQSKYEASVKRAKEHVLDGDIYQGVISRRKELTGSVDPLGFYSALREVNPSPYMYLLQHDDLTIVGASPETLVSVTGDRVVSNPIAGTCPRGESPVEDRRLAGEMLADDKERAEHTMLVDLARNDVRRVAAPGTVRVEEFMNVLKYSHVQHIESTVTGTLASSADAFDATRAAFPAGTLSGAPKIRAMEIIDELESSPRGLYGGGVGYYSWNGDADFAIVIRTATIENHGENQRITVRAGAGLVADSDPTAEYEETNQKMEGVLVALDQIRIDEESSTDVSSTSQSQSLSHSSEVNR